MTKWARLLDVQGRLYTLEDAGLDASPNARYTLYFPDTDDEFLRFPKGSSFKWGEGPLRNQRIQFDEKDRNYHLGPEIALEVPSVRIPGTYFPRIWMGPETPSPELTGLRDAWVSTVRAGRILYARLRDVFRTIEPAHHNRLTYGHELRQLLILAATEVESSWKAVLRANGYVPAKGNDSWTRRDYSHLRDIMGLTQYGVRLSEHPSFGVIWPFADWTTDGGPEWYNAYNQVKHDREGKLSLATLEHAVSSLAAVFVMTIAQFGDRFVNRDPYFNPDEFTPVGYPRSVAIPSVASESESSTVGDSEPGISTWYIRALPIFDESGTYLRNAPLELRNHPYLERVMAKRASDMAAKKPRGA